jgi:hypothetical protein
MTTTPRPAGSLVSFVIGLIYTASLILLVLGVINYQVRNLGDTITRLLGSEPRPVEYRVAIDYNNLIEHQSRMIAQIETLDVPGYVRFAMPDYTFPGPLDIPVSTDAEFSMEYMAHVGFDLTDPESYSIEFHQLDDSVSIRYALPEPRILALEIPEGAIEDFFIDTPWFVPAGIRLQMNSAMFPEAIAEAATMAEAEIEGDPAYYQQAMEDLESALEGYAEDLFEGKQITVEVTFGGIARTDRTDR